MVLGSIICFEKVYRLRVVYSYKIAFKRGLVKITGG